MNDPSMRSRDAIDRWVWMRLLPSAHDEAGRAAPRQGRPALSPSLPALRGALPLRDPPARPVAIEACPASFAPDAADAGAASPGPPSAGLVQTRPSGAGTSGLGLDRAL